MQEFGAGSGAQSMRKIALARLSTTRMSPDTEPPAHLDRPFPETEMASISNKTPKPLRVPLPQGKTLHLGAGKTGQVNAKALQHPPLLKLVEAGDLEIDDGGKSSHIGGLGSQGGISASEGHEAGGGPRRSGDR